MTGEAINVYPKLDYAFEITKKALDKLPVSLNQLVHKLGQFVDGKTNVRTGDGEVLQGTNSAAK